MTTQTQPVTLDPATIQRAKANIALLMISLGVPLLILSSYSLLRQAFVASQTAGYTEVPLPPDGVPGRLQRSPGLYHPRPEPTATVAYQEPIPVPTAEGPVVDTAPPEEAVYGHDTTIPGCRVEEDGQMHCWGGFEPVIWAMTAEEQATYRYYIDDDTGQPVVLDAPTTGFRSGTSQHNSLTDMARHVGRWTAPGYSTSSGLGGN